MGVWLRAGLGLGMITGGGALAYDALVYTPNQEAAAVYEMPNDRGHEETLQAVEVIGAFALLVGGVTAVVLAHNEFERKSFERPAPRRSRRR